MAPTATIDYEALAKQAGAVKSAPAKIDYAALAKQAGAISSDVPDTPPPPSTLSERYSQIGAQQRAAAQQESYKAFGPEAQGQPILSRAGAALKSLGHEATGVGASVLSGVTDPTQAAIMSTGLVDPAIPAAYYATKGTASLAGIGEPSSVATAIKNPTPENVQAPLLQGAMVAGGASAANAPGAGATATAAKAIPDVTRRVAQEALNVGPRLTEQATAKIKAFNDAAIAKSNEATEAFRSKVETQKAMTAADLEKHQAAVADVQRQNADAMAEHQQTVKDLTAINNARTAEYEGAKAQQAQKAQLVNDVTQNGATLATGLKSLEAKVRAEGSAKFDVVNKAVEGQVADAGRMQGAVEHAQSKILAGSPESIKIFNSILNDTHSEGATEVAEAGPTHPLYQQMIEKGAVSPEGTSFRDLQGYYTELGQKMSAGNLPGDVYRALKYVRNEIGNQMQEMAAKGGVAQQLTEARQFWHRYESTFHDMRPIAQGGSPVARAFRAIDPDYAVTPFTGKAGLRAIQQVSQYDPLLADTAKQTMAKFNQIRSIPKGEPKAPTLKPIPEPPTPKALPAPPRIRPSPEMPPSPELKTVDPAQAKVEATQKIADYLRGEGGWRIWSDVVAGAGAAHALFISGRPEVAAGYMAFPIIRRLAGAGLEKPSFLKWISKPTAEEATGVRTAPTGLQGAFPTPKGYSGGGSPIPTISAAPKSTESSLMARARQAYTSGQMEGKLRVGMLTPEDVMLAAKEGRITPAQARSLTQRMGKGATITKPMEPPR